ncbi:hypothetical protein [Streptococcus sp. zg-JUN1979]|uniref:hypothetical protein n=1 Tax=Streptococcus sp. zg-JUN1979 TaxID=3391450 RepID=UPI0039AEC64F
MKTLGQLLQLPPFHFFYEIPIAQQSTSSDNDNYIIAFKAEDKVLFVNTEALDGQADSLASASHLSAETLLVGLGAVPSPYWESCYILEVPQNETQKGAELANVLKHYSYIDLFQDMEEQYHRPHVSAVYDPYRYAYTIDEKEVSKDKHFTKIAKKDYEGIRDFHPFIKTNRGNVYSVSCTYQDKEKAKTPKIYLMGWYFYDNKQLKISWKPAHTRKSRWRSSLVSVDKRTERFFFQGELYKKGSFPIFLDQLSFNNKTYEKQLKHEFDAFLSIIEEQKEKANLRYK